MKQFWHFAGAILLLSLILFVFFEQIGIKLLDEPETFIQNQSMSAALIAVCLLIADVFLPVPSSLIMIANGAIFGPFIGTIVSLIGCMGATWSAFLIGKQSRPWVIARFVSAEQMANAQQLFEQWGMAALIVTRPIPLLAETTAIVAGTSGMAYREMFIAALAGSVPAAALYAFTGSIALELNSALWSFGLVIMISVLFWYLPKAIQYYKV